MSTVDISCVLYIYYIDNMPGTVHFIFKKKIYILKFVGVFFFFFGGGRF